MTSYTTAQFPVHARQSSLISDPTSTVTASQCSAYGCIGAHIPTVIDTAIVAAVGPCEGGEPGGAVQSADLDHHPGVGVCGCGVGPSRGHQGNYPSHCSDLANILPAVYNPQYEVLEPTSDNAVTMTVNQTCCDTMSWYTATGP